MPKSKEFLSSSSGSESDEPKPKKKREEKKKSSKGATSKETTAERGPNGEQMFQIARMRYVTVSDFRGKTYVGIREYYENDAGDMKPGKKGISLPCDQWEKLKSVMDDVDEAIKNS